VAVIPSRLLRRPASRPLSFSDENAAKHYLENLLTPFFFLKFEMWCRHPRANNQLRVDYVAKAKPNVAFPFDWFCVEVKKSCASGGAYNAAHKQVIDYTFCKIDDPRPDLARIDGARVERIYLFRKGADDDLTGAERGSHDAFWVNLLAGKFHVGMICEIRGLPAFHACADRQSCPWHGARRSKHNTRQIVGSGGAERIVS